MRSCMEARFGVTSALEARAAVYMAAVVAAGAACGSPTVEFKLFPRSKWRLGVGGGALALERTQV
jgi:hypothetical protein